MKALTVKVPEPLLADIEAAAKERKVSRSEIIRERLEQGAGRSGSSLWSRMEDLLIDDEGLPQDLSSNKNHLENYGKGRTD
jgi:hypothetical protein